MSGSGATALLNWAVYASGGSMMAALEMEGMADVAHFKLSVSLKFFKNFLKKKLWSDH